MRDFPCRRFTHFVPLLPEHKRRADDLLQFKPKLETLEPRQLMTADNQDWQGLLSHGGVCNCSICTGQGLNEIAASATVTTTPTGTLALTNPLTSIPQLSSNSSATAKLFLDFNGHTQASWGNYTNVVTPVYDQDGNRTTFSNAELASIQEIWARVAEDYAPFNIDVTTIDPGNSTNGVTARIAIGGDYSDWFGQSAGGVAYIGGFYNGAPNVGYVFEDALGNGNARYVAEAASHEAGHLFGLLHQAQWNGNTLVNSYSQGTSALAPIMGVGYYSQRTTWHNGPTDNGPTAYQDDMSILANGSNGFGYRADDFGSTLSLASVLAATNGAVNFAGRIGANGDEDWFSFTTTGGNLNLTLNVATVGANLDSVLELRNASGTVLVTASPTNSLSATLTSTLASGTYYVVVKSSGGYGNVGQYTLSGTAPIGSTGGGGGSGGEDTSAPEINVLNGTVNVLTGGSINFGSVQVGSGVNRTITIRNTGTAALSLTPPTAEDMPAGYSIVTNLGSTSLAAGASTTMTVRFTPTATGTTAGALTLLSNDADEGSFVINFTGSATPAPAPEIGVFNGTVAVSSGGTIGWGNVQVSKFLNKTITIKNTGNAALTIVRPTAADMPAGFSIVTNFTSTSIAAGGTGTITVRYTPTAVGPTSGTLTLVSSDSDEGSYVLNLTGTGTPGPQPEINVLNGTVNVLTGGNIDFGSVQLSKFVNKTITIKNTGTAALTIVRPTAADLPAGFTIVTNFASTSIAAGMTGTITLRYTPTAVGPTTGSLTIVSNDSDEGSFVINLSGTATPGPTPEIDVKVGTLDVQSGGTIDFGSVAVGQSVNQVITIKNTGTAALTLVKPTAGQLPAGFTIVTNFTSTSLAAGASASLTLKYTPTALGASGGLLNLVSNDADEATYALNLTGTGTPAPIIRAIDNGSTGFAVTGTWTRTAYIGREADIQTALKGNGSTTATWTFTGMPAGQYRVHASWTASSLQASDAPFTIHDGDTALSTVDVNQKVASSGFTWSGTNWSNLGTFDITGDTIRVTLTNAANERVVADAVRIERIGDLPSNAAAASSVVELAHADVLPVFVAPTSESSSSFNPATPLSAFSFSLSSATNPTTAVNSALEELFAAAADSRAELLLLDDALDLLRTTENALGSDEQTPHNSPSDELSTENWLLSEDLNLLLR